MQSQSTRHRAGMSTCGRPTCARAEDKGGQFALCVHEFASACSRAVATAIIRLLQLHNTVQGRRRTEALLTIREGMQKQLSASLPA